jgi:Uma2 family endonuclease
MTAPPDNNNWTIEQYLDFEDEQETRHEFIQGQVYAMAGATERHNQIASAIHYALYGQMLDRDCQVFQSDMRVQVEADVSFYPDIVAICGEARYAEEKRIILLNPTLVIEVLSPSTEDYDRGRKFNYYRRFPSLKEYLLVSQEKMQIDHYIRQDENAWLLQGFSMPERKLELSSIGCILLIHETYRKVNFEVPD